MNVSLICFQFLIAPFKMSSSSSSCLYRVISWSVGPLKRGFAGPRSFSILVMIALSAATLWVGIYPKNKTFETYLFMLRFKFCFKLYHCLRILILHLSVSSEIVVLELYEGPAGNSVLGFWNAKLYENYCYYKPLKYSSFAKITFLTFYRIS